MKTIHKSLLVASTLSFAQQTLAAPPEVTTIFGSTWSGVGFVLGYGAEPAYVKYACSGTDPGASADCDGPPRIGLVRTLAKMGDAVMTALAYQSCADIPTTGTKAVTLDGATVTITFATPKQKIPAAWAGGGTAFDRRMEYTRSMGTETIKMVQEVSCSQGQTQLMAMNMIANAENAPGYVRAINIWTGTISGDSVADIYTIEKKVDLSVRGVYAYNVRINEASKNYKLVGGQTTHFNEGSTAAMDVFNVNGNYNSHQISMRSKRFVISKGNSSTGNQVDAAGAITAMTGSGDALLTAATSYGLLTPTATTTEGPLDGMQGCMDFDDDATAPTAATACTGLDFLTEVPKPVIDATDGSFSAKWILNTAKSKLVEIPDL